MTSAVAMIAETDGRSRPRRRVVADTSPSPPIAGDERSRARRRASRTRNSEPRHSGRSVSTSSESPASNAPATSAVTSRASASAATSSAWSASVPGGGSIPTASSAPA
jgi:hypothetical protein